MFINLILTSLFFIVMMFGVIAFVIAFRDWAVKRDAFYIEQINRMRKDNDDLRTLFKNDISDILIQVKNIIK